jgi:hypothetical protein
MKTTVFSHIRKRALLCIMLLILIGESCVDPLSVPGLNSKRLVIDGLITNEAGPHEVEVYYALTVNEKDSVSYPDASVAVEDDLGNRYVFTAHDSGIHKSDFDLHGEVGRTYTLEVKLADGNVYRSTPQRMPPAGEIENLYAEFEPESINLHDIAATYHSYAIYVDSKGGDHNLFRWRTTGTYEVRTFPELHVKYVSGGSGGQVIEVPDPLPCSGFYFDEQLWKMFHVHPCECCFCWITEYNDGVKISDSRYVNDNEFNRVFVARIPFDGVRFYNKYHILVEQLSLSDDAYEFWKTVKSQEGNSSIFQANIARATSNIINETSPSEEVLGCFAASAVSRKTIFIGRFDAPVPPLFADDTVITDCRKYKHSTNQKPPFW